MSDKLLVIHISSIHIHYHVWMLSNFYTGLSQLSIQVVLTFWHILSFHRVIELLTWLSENSKQQHTLAWGLDIENG